MSTREIIVDYLARVEGEGALTLRFRGDVVEHVELRIYEPPRFFEGFLQGRMAAEAPDITARICGICPVAYQMSACRAVEDALGLALPETLQAWRRMLYCGEWIESHVLHVMMLHAPDFLGVPDVMAMARDHGDHVRTGLRVKKAGNAIVRLLGGREIHPINVKIGGFYRLPRKSELRALVDELEICRALWKPVVRWTASFDFPELHREPVFLASRPLDGRYPFMGGPLQSTTGHRFRVDQYLDHVEEQHVPWSTALHAQLDGALYQVGPVARWNVCFDRLPKPLRELGKELGVAPPVYNPFRSIVIRGIEVLYALDEAIRIARSAAVDGPAGVEAELTGRPGRVGHGVTEAPRGLLYHRYVLDEEGKIAEARIIPPTSQNQPSIEADLRAIAPSLVPMEDEPASMLAEQTIRNYDPCISCSTHFLTLKREQL